MIEGLFWRFYAVVMGGFIVCMAGGLGVTIMREGWHDREWFLVLMGLSALVLASLGLPIIWMGLMG